MHRTRSIRTRNVLEHLGLTLTFQRRITTTHDRIAQIVDAVVVVPNLTLIKRKVFVADLHDQFVDIAGHVHEAVHFVEDGDAVERLIGFPVKEHWGREDVRVVVGDFDEAAAAYLNVRYGRRM
jgi:hypothetical protein